MNSKLMYHRPGPVFAVKEEIDTIENSMRLF